MKLNLNDFLAIQEHWYKKKGLFILFVIEFIVSYFIFTTYFNDIKQIWFCFIITILILFILSYFIWIFSTFRKVIKWNDDFILGIIFQIEEDDKNKDFVFTIEKAYQKIKETVKGKKIRLIKYPMNFNKVFNVNEALLKRTIECDLVISFEIVSGNVDNDHQSHISNFHFSINMHSNINIKEKLHYFLSNIGMSNHYKQWYIGNSNSFKHKIEVSNNLELLVYNVIGLSLIINKKYEEATFYIEKLFNQIEFNKKINQPEYKDSKEFLGTSNVLIQLTQLYLNLSENYLYNNQKKSLLYLQKLENLSLKGEHEFLMHIRMARMYYECGDLNNAIISTAKAEKISKNDFTININRAFFAILDNNNSELLRNLKIIFNKRKTFVTGIISVIDFLSKEKKKYPEKEVLLDYVIHFYQTLFVDLEHGKKNLIQSMDKIIKSNYEESNIFESLTKTVISKVKLSK